MAEAFVDAVMQRWSMRRAGATADAGTAGSWIWLRNSCAKRPDRVSVTVTATSDGDLPKDSVDQLVSIQ